LPGYAGSIGATRKRKTCLKKDGKAKEQADERKTRTVGKLHNSNIMEFKMKI